MNQFTTVQAFDKYFQTSTRNERLQCLQHWKSEGRSLPDAVVMQLLALPLSNMEQIALLECTKAVDPESYEFWIFGNLLKWPQDVAAIALRSWASETSHQLWHRLIPILKVPVLPQRLSYTILEISPAFAGKFVTQTILETAGWEDFSPAHHGLLFDRGIQFDCRSKRLDHLALEIVSEAKANIHPEDKSLQSAVGWLIRSNLTKQLEQIASSSPYAAWKAALNSTLDAHSQRKKIFEKALKSAEKNPHTIMQIIQEGPAPWSRADLPPELLRLVISSEGIDNLDLASVLNGVSTATIAETYKAHKTGLSSQCQSTLSRWLGESPMLTAELTDERNAMLGKDGSLSQIKVTSSPTSNASSLKDKAREYFGASRQTFFEGIKGEKTSAVTSNDYWGLLTTLAAERLVQNLQAISVESRKQKGLATLCYLSTLGRLKGQDEAVLKIMDHVRTSEEDELRVIVSSLGDIDTPRSLQELIASITRPNATQIVQQEAVSILAKRDVSALQKELRATVQDLKVPADPTSPIAEIREALVNLLQVAEADNTGKTHDQRANASQIDDKSLDEELGGMIPNYRALSSEVRRALRTALFFNRSISGSETSHAIDLSPLIDMQYKAMELLFREFFEDLASQALHKGDIPRKLDVIGYARPIPFKMDEFENYIASLPVVREIPFFSKFKLRKMLRAICQFQPGRRFTLDGLKAFGLFFLCFSRSQCRFGLADLFSIGAKDDKELAEFARELHIFQDFRNRAAHEGFHPEASNDIQGIWRSTALIVQWAFRIRDHFAVARTTAPKAEAQHRQAS